jgi:hypothetical protein
MPNLRWSFAALVLALVTCVPPPTEPARGLSSCLPAPRVSEDACTKDADCAPSDSCHALACVASSKARPPTPGTYCLDGLDCHSADANRCACYEGRCALVPPNP